MFSGKENTMADTYYLAVLGGSGCGDYEKGEVVYIEADPAPTGQRFKCWKVNAGGIRPPASSPGIDFAMPGRDVELEAVYGPNDVKSVAKGVAAGFFTRDKLAWVLVIIGTIAAILIGSGFGDQFTRGLLFQVSTSYEAYKVLEKAATEVFASAGLRLYDLGGVELSALMWFVAAVLALRALSKKGATPRECLWHIATILAATAAAFAVKNIWVAVMTGLPWAMIPIPALVVGIGLAIATLLLLKKQFKK